MWLARSEVHMRSLTQVANVPAERNCAELLFFVETTRKMQFTWVRSIELWVTTKAG